MNRSIYKLLLFCMVSMLSVFVHAASLQVTYHINDATETVTSGVSTDRADASKCVRLQKF